jgi:hypothetical protein
MTTSSEKSRIFRDESLESRNERGSCFGACILGVVTIPHVCDEFCVAAQPADDFKLKIKKKIEEDIHPRIGTLLRRLASMHDAYISQEIAIDSWEIWNQ